MGTLEQCFLLVAQFPALVQVAVRADLEAAAVCFLHQFRIALGVEAGHEEGGRHAVALEQIHVARHAAAAGVAADCVRAERTQLAPGLVRRTVEVHGQADGAAYAVGPAVTSLHLCSLQSLPGRPTEWYSDWHGWPAAICTRLFLRSNTCEDTVIVGSLPG